MRSEETIAPNPLELRYEDVSCRVLMTGVQALARLPLDQARRDRASGLNTGAFISGYEGSPLGGYDLELARQQKLLEEHGVRFEPGLNEEAAAMAVQGTQLIRELTPTVEGVTGYWYGKAPGLDRATDALRHANLMGTDPNGGAVAFVGDDPAAKSSSVPCASEAALADLRMPLFYPSDAADVLTLGRHAVSLSRACGLWSSMKIVTAVADGSTTVELETGDSFHAQMPSGACLHEPTSRLLQPTLGPLERDFLTTRTRIARDYIRLNRLNHTVLKAPGDTVGIIAAGPAYLDTLRALSVLGFDTAGLAGTAPTSAGPTSPDKTPGAQAPNRSSVRVMKLDVIWPLDPVQIAEFAQGLDTLIVIEEKRAFVEAQVRDALYGAEHRPQIFGKTDETGRELFPEYGELNSDLLLKGLAGQLARLPEAPGVQEWLERTNPNHGTRINLPLLARTPYFCSGCPHNSSTKPRTDSAFGAGIGCHAMVLLMDPKQVGSVVGLTQMGGEGTQWIGMAPFVENGHFVQNLGDGTFHHSGSLAIRASVAARTNITYRILYNSTVAMTGGQDAVGQMDVPEMARALLAEGVARVIVTSDDPKPLRKKQFPSGVQIWHRERLGEAQEILAATPGTTVLIHEQECATELRRKRKRGLKPKPEEFVMINERICEGCGDCGEKSNCLSVQPVQTEFGRKTRIHQSSCNVDMSCLDGECPAFMTVRPGQSRRQGSGLANLEPTDLPDPPSRENRTHRVRLMGIGGTGVVTTSQLLATAAILSGRYARTLDRTGLAQKGGAVVSDVTIAHVPIGEGNGFGAGECDLYLGYDLLVASDQKHLAGLALDSTAIVSTSVVPTGPMVSDPNVIFPEVNDTLARVRERLGEGQLRDLDLRRYAEGLFGAEQMGNMFVLGVAVQLGALTLLPESIEEAIALNGVAVNANTQAFRRGRQFVADRAALDAVLHEQEVDRTPKVHPPSQIVRAEKGSELERLVAIRRAELTRYQNAAYARKYEVFVERVRAAEVAHTNAGTPLSEAVSRHLYKLMAYKDEYEVARLALDPAMSEEVTQQFGEGASVQWRLHPPTLKALGLKRKIRLGPWFRPAFVALRAARRLRGTALDPFGYDRVRKLERALIAEYEAVLSGLLAQLAETGATEVYETAIEVAALPDMIRGYDSVKLRNVEGYREELVRLLGTTQGSRSQH